jgi:transcriptional regulator with XRE-family HTH domain
VVLGWERVGALVKAERRRRGLTQPGFSDRYGLSVRILSDIENGARGNFDDQTKALIEAAMRWAPGSVDAVLSGAEPAARLDDAWERLSVLWPDLAPAVRRAILALAETLRGL